MPSHAEHTTRAEAEQNHDHLEFSVPGFRVWNSGGEFLPPVGFALTLRAKVRAPLADADALDGGAAAIAGFTCPVINLKLVLEAAAAVNPDNAGTVGFDARPQHKTDAFQQAGGLVNGQGV